MWVINVKWDLFSKLSCVLTKHFSTKTIDLELAREDVSLTRAVNAFAQNKYQQNQGDRQDFLESVLWNFATRGIAGGGLEAGYAHMVGIMAEELVKRGDLEPDKVPAFKAYGQECFDDPAETWRKIKYGGEVPYFIAFTKVLSDGSPDGSTLPRPDPMD